ncbi:prenyltransferase [Thalassotalea euphylliae]|uniref:prenyltransferase n=1 Tax=Thalassotalea euphylliae TaxID=1655234 RepID=UPI00362BA7F5
MNNVIATVKTMRPPFLLLTPICIFLAYGLASYHGYPLPMETAALALVCAMLGHIAVNMLNEYQDFKSGLDLNTTRTPFSGGSGALVATPSAADVTKTIAYLAIALIVIIGLYLSYTRTWLLVPLGIAGLVTIYQYTSTLNKLPWLCHIAPGFGFAWIMILGTFLSLTYTITLDAVAIAAIPFLLINNLLLLNQFPDIMADKAHGRNTLPIAYGTKISAYVYTTNVLLAFGLVIFLVETRVLPETAYWAFCTLPFALISILGAFEFGQGIGSKPFFLTTNVVVSLVTPFIIALTLW